MYRKIVIAAGVCAALYAPNSDAQQLQRIFTEGDTLAGGWVVDNIGQPTIGAYHEPVFTARTTSPSGLVVDRLIRAGPQAGQARAVVSVGDQAPGGNGSFQSAPSAYAHPSGMVAFATTLRNTSSHTNSRGIFADPGNAGPLTTVIRSDPAGTPDLAPYFAIFAVGDDRQIFFSSDIYDRPGLWRMTVGGAPIPITHIGSPVGSRWQLNQVNASFTRGSGVAVRANLRLGEITSSALLRTDPDGTTRQIAREGQPCPWTPGQIQYISQDAPTNNAGRVAFSVSCRGPSSTNDEAIMFDDNGTLRTVVYENVAAPSGDGYLSYPGLGSRFFLNSQGDALFQSGLRGTSNPAYTGYFLIGDAGLREVARERGPAPRNGIFGSLRGIYGISDGGSAIFTAQLSADGSLNVGLFEYKQGTVRPIVVVGDVLPGLGRVTFFDLEQYRLNFNADGQFAFRVSTVDNAGNTRKHVMVWSSQPGSNDFIFRSGFE